MSSSFPLAEAWLAVLRVRRQLSTGIRFPIFYKGPQPGRLGALFRFFKIKRHNFQSLRVVFAIQLNQERSLIVAVRTPASRDAHNHNFIFELLVRVRNQLSIQIREGEAERFIGRHRIITIEEGGRNVRSFLRELNRERDFVIIVLNGGVSKSGNGLRRGYQGKKQEKSGTEDGFHHVISFGSGVNCF